jgi:Transglutaminase-like superfamily
MISDELLNVAARILLRTVPPLTAHAVLSRVGRLLPQRLTRQDVQRAASSLSSRGTCLSRTLALAATAPDADVVIGVQPGGDRALSAHAWIEMEGRPLPSEHPLGQEIARLRRPRRPTSAV